MKLQVNLLPDTKQQKLKTKARQKNVISIALLSMLIGLGLPLILLGVHVTQRALLNRTQDSIDAKLSQLSGDAELQKILTVQSQMNSLPALSQDKHYYSTLLDTVQAVLPPDVFLSDMQVDSASSVLSLTGEGPSFQAINEFVDAMRSVGIKIEDSQQFPLSNIRIDSVSPTETGVNFVIFVTFDPVIVQPKLPGTLTIPPQPIRLSPSEGGIQ